MTTASALATPALIIARARGTRIGRTEARRVRRMRRLSRTRARRMTTTTASATLSSTAVPAAIATLLRPAPRILVRLVLARLAALGARGM